MINQIWFLVLAGMLATYAVLDGFDLGAGVLHLLIGRSQEDRETIINAIGPVWNGNEVWLIASGGAMVVAFPHLYATAFSGFYLALMLVLWLLLLRGLGIEFRHQLENPLWHHAWDVTFSLASILLTVLFGVALANVLRGVPLDASGQFQGSFGLLLNPFSVLGGVLALAVLGLHGGAYLAAKTTGALQTRARASVGLLWWAVLVLIAAMVAGSFPVRPDFGGNYLRAPALFLVPLFGLACLVAIRVFHAARRDRAMFLASAGTIVGILGSGAAGLFPRLLPTQAGGSGVTLDIYNAAAASRSLRIALGIYLVGIGIVVIYLARIYRVWKGPVTHEDGYRV